MRQGCAKNNAFCRRGAPLPERGNKAAPATTFKWRTGLHFAPRLSPGGGETGWRMTSYNQAAPLKGMFWFLPAGGKSSEAGSWWKKKDEFATSFQTSPFVGDLGSLFLYLSPTTECD